jgi:hypothetical protein
MADEHAMRLCLKQKRRSIRFIHLLRYRGDMIGLLRAHVNLMSQGLNLLFRKSLSLFAGLGEGRRWEAQPPRVHTLTKLAEDDQEP